LGFTAVLGVPLFVDGRPAGVFAINGGSRPFSEDDVQTLMLLAQQASAALERMRARRHLMALTLHEERTRLASELHDGLAQDLASLLLRTDLCLQMASDAPEEVRGALEGIGQGLQRCIRDARATIFALRKADADPADLEDGVRAQVARFESRTHLPVSVQVTGCPTVPAPRSHLLVLLSALQEALRNVERHARASQVLIRIGYDRDAAIRVSVQDDGVGFDPAFLAAPCTGSLHFGLADHLERLAGLGGVLHVRSAPGKGATIEAVLPVHAS
jgi:signal transduction histidine kinase